MLDAGEDPSSVDGASGLSALMLAAENQQAGSMRLLLDRGADATYTRADGWTALHHAVDSECDGELQTGELADGRLVAMLVAAGADPDAAWGSGGATPRSMAVRYGLAAVEQALNG